MKVALSINDIRDLDMHRNNGVTNLNETRVLLNGMYSPGSKEILSAYGFLSLQHYVSQAFIWIQAQKTVQSGWIAMR